MQITETHSQGLKRELKVVIAAHELSERMEARLGAIKSKVQLKGFRPGKVPIEHIRKTYGRSIMAEVVQEAVNEVTVEALKERNERPAFQPEIKLPEDVAEVEKVMSGQGDLEYTMSFEVLPKIDLKDLKSIKVEKQVAEVQDEEIEKSLEQLRQANVTYTPKDGPAETGDQVTIDFKGFIDGEAFEGGSAEDATVVLGQGRFLPGFEDGLMGVKAGDTPVIKITFPENYGAKHLAGKPAEFNVTVKEVGSPVAPEANDEFAKSLGLESLEKLREALSARIAREYESISRAKLKKALLDALDEQYSFELPPSLVESEFKAIWDDMQQHLQRASKTFEDEGTTEEKAREEYQRLAERRVRLGLLLSEIGQQNDIKISDDDVKRAILERARQYPGQEKRVVEFYQKNPEALAEIRAPLYEEKVVRFILELADVTEKPVSVAELLRSGDEREHDHDHVCGPDCDHDHHDHDHGRESGKVATKKSKKKS